MSQETPSGPLASNQPDGPEKTRRLEVSGQTEDIPADLLLVDCLASEVAVLDATGRIIHVNKAWTQFARENGSKDSGPLGVGANYLSVCRNSIPEAEEAQRILQALNDVMSGATSLVRLEYPCHAADEQRWFQVCITPSPEPGGAVLCHTDITGPVMARRKFQQSEQHYRDLIENEVDIVTILDPEGYIQFESPAIKRILGYTPEEMIGRHVFELIHPNDLAAVKQAFQAVLSSNEPSKPLEFRFRHAESGYKVVESIARKLPDHSVVHGVIVNSRDISDRRAAEAALRRQKAALKRSHEQLRALSGRLLGLADRERRRLSRELHDDLSQTLAALAVDIGTLASGTSMTPVERVEEQLRELQGRLVEASTTVRKLAHQLHPSILDDLGLPVALQSYCQQFERREHIEVQFTYRNLGRDLSPDVASCIYRVTQEALRNVAKHAKATNVSVSAVGTTRNVVLKIHDNGIGFAPESLSARRGLGLTSMAERSRLVNGTFRVVSAPQKGTILELRVPRQVKSE